MTFTPIKFESEKSWKMFYQDNRIIEFKGIVETTWNWECTKIFHVIELKDGSIVAAGDEDNFCFIKMIKQGEVTYLRGHRDHITALIKLQDGRFATGSHDKTIKIWKDKKDGPARPDEGQHPRQSIGGEDAVL